MDDSRCRKCGRKPDDTLSGEFALPWTAGALATKPQTETRQERVVNRPAPVAVSTPEGVGRRTPTSKPSVQGWLFRDGSASNVIPFESYVLPRGPEPLPPQARAPQIRVKPGFGTKPPAPLRPSRAPETQQQLDFLPSLPAKPKTLSDSVEASIFSDEPVATLLHRAVAGALDWSMVLIGYGLFLAVFRIAGGVFTFDKMSLLILAGMLPLLGVAYGLVWAVAGADTMGMKWTRLRMTTFEGFALERKHRLLRFLGSCLSLCTVVGLVWAVIDEENLTWQDHISGTFPTPER